MSEAVIHETSDRPRWRRIIDYPLIAMLIAVILCVVTAHVAGELGKHLPIPPSPLRRTLRAVLILGSLLAVYKLIITRLGEQPRDDLTGRRALPDLGIGLAIGFLIMALSVGAAAIANVYHLIGEGDASDLLNAVVGAAIMPAFTEELLFRGILFRWIEEFGGSWAALFVTSALFGAAHLMNPNATYIAALGIAVEAGVLLGAGYMLTRSLWLVMGIHAAWNFTQGEIFDIPVSGTPVHGLFVARLSGPPLLTGNGFGLEASLIAIIVATLFGLGLLWLAIRRGELMPPRWVRLREANALAPPQQAPA